MSEPCCDLHGRNCEPPSELCCGNCTEANHPDHPAGETCSNPVLSNAQCAGVRGDVIVVAFPKTHMTKREALTHAAWLVALADDGDEFPAVLAAIRQT
jgi:hypothetical protein